MKKANTIKKEMPAPNKRLWRHAGVYADDNNTFSNSKW
jgi:hypothetical protein